MRSSPATLDASPTPDLDLELDGYVEAFESAALIGAADLADFLPPAGHPKYRAVLSELIRADLEFAWERGHERRLEEYRERFPSLFSDATIARELAAEEFRLRQVAGEEPDPLEYRTRFGIDLFGLSDSTSTAVRVVPKADWPLDRVPQLGDTIPPGFVLESVLGVGTFGRVFRARQADLAGRPVAVKLSLRLVGESQTLARLQHTNIVPVYSVHRVGRFTALVMPYLGRTTLADLIDTFRSSGNRPATSRAAFSTLMNRACATMPESASAPNAVPSISAATTGIPPSTLERLNRYSFVELVLWIGSELADGLAHAHERGILHRDIKPANVLFTDDGRPMLLDFNLAADAGLAAGAGEIGGVGGTLRYMAPEQLSAFKSDRNESSTQADLYALGLVLFELMAGRLPFADHQGLMNDVLDRMVAERMRPLDQSRLPSEVTPAVVSILRKCLAPERTDRYLSAADLREDLQRQLANRPLQFAPETSPRERFRKWARRHPRLSSSATMGAVAAGILAVVVSAFLLRQRNLEWLEDERVRDDLRTAVAKAYVATGPEAEAREIRATLIAALAPFHVEAEDWADRSLVRRLPDSNRAVIRQDALVAMNIIEQLSTRLSENVSDPARRAAYRDEASEWRARFLREADVGLEKSSHASLREGRLVEKAATLRAMARDSEPRFATWMTLGTVEAKLERHESAVEAFSAALGMNPRDPWPYLHRGIARLELKEYSSAQADFDRFIERVPGGADGYFNRGIARLHLADERGAIADLDEAVRLGLTLNRLYVLRARAKRQLGDEAGADRDQKEAIDSVPTDARAWAVRGELKLSSRPPDPKSALADFEKSLEIDADFLPALRDQASVLSENLNRASDALAVLDRVLELVPQSMADRAGRAVLLARLGRKIDALKEAEACAKSESPLILYQAASAMLIANDSAAIKLRVIVLLRSALRKDPTWSKSMPTDPDLKSILSEPAFRELVAAASVLAREK